MNDRFPLAMLGGVVLVGALSWFVMRGAQRGSFAETLSTLKSEPDGARALYVFLSESGLPVARHSQDLTFIPPKRNLVLLGTRFDDEEALHQKSFDGSSVDAGETDDEKDVERKAQKWGTPSITKEETETLLTHVRNGSTVIYVPATDHQSSSFLKALEVSVQKAADVLDKRTLVPAQPSRYVRHVQRVITPIDVFFELPDGAVPLLVDEVFDKPVVASIPYGQGRVILIGASELTMNRTLAVADNAQFWHSLISTVSGAGPVFFDEFHHGFTGSRSLGEFAGKYGLHFAVGQLLLGIALWALSLRRFGSPRVMLDEQRVGGTDALFATSRLYREGKHFNHAASSIVKRLAAERAGVSIALEPEEIATLIQQRGRTDLARTLFELTRAARATASEADLEHVAMRCAAARHTLKTSPREHTP